MRAELLHRPRTRAGIGWLRVGGVLLALLMGGLYLFPPTLLTFIDNKIFDILVRATTPRPIGGNVVLVDIDEAGLARHGQWPWPRYRVAQLLDRIRESGASTVAIDVNFAEPDRTSLTVLREEIRRDFDIDIAPAGFSRLIADNDATLADVLGRGPFILGYQFLFGGTPGPPACALPPLRFARLRRGGTDLLDPFFRATGTVCPLESLARAAPGAGFVNVIPDTDGILRRVPLIIARGGDLYPSLALAAAMRYLGRSEVILESTAEGVIAVRLGDRRIPLDARGNLLVTWRGRRHTFPYISAADFLEGKVQPQRLRGKLVVFGVSGAGLLELRSTPLDAAHPGPEIQATLAEAIITGDFISRPPWLRLVEFLLILALGVGMTFFLVHASAMRGLAVTVVMIPLLGLAAWWLMARWLVLFSPFSPALTLAAEFAFLTSLRFRLAEREVRERTRKLAKAQDAVIQSLAGLAETRDLETGGHIQRTRHYVRILARHLMDHPRFSSFLDEETVELLFRLAPLHDIGKVGVRDAILLKTDRLTPAEFEEMKLHTVYGSNTIRMAEANLGSDSFLRLADDFALAHQEKWDGSGYPKGLQGEEIPMAGRLMAVADVYDALISRRGYKPPLGHEEAVRIMTAARGTHFDPDILDAFLATSEQFRRIAETFAGAGTEGEIPPLPAPLP